MPNHFYKIRKNRLVAGVVAGLGQINLAGILTLARVLAIILLPVIFHAVWNLLILSFSPPPSL